jgi:hypothetical protein
LQKNILRNGVEQEKRRKKGGGENGQGLFSDGATHQETMQKEIW